MARSARAMTISQPPTREAFDRLGVVLCQAITVDPVGGFSAAVTHRGEPVWTSAAGAADHERGIAVTPATIFRVGSISKTVAVACALRLHARGALDLDAPVAATMPEVEAIDGYHAQVAPISLRDLAGHTSGLAREPSANAELWGADGPVERWADAVVTALGSARFAHPRGSCFDYSNIGIGILGVALQRATTRPYPDLVNEELCAPLGLHATGFRPPDDRDTLATGYERLTDGSLSSAASEEQHVGRGYRLPGGGLYSTAAEIAQIVDAIGPFADDRLLSATARRAMATPASRKSEEASPGPSNAYGLGLELYLDHGDPGATLAFGHHGDLSGYSAFVLFAPEHGTTLAVCCNFHGNEEWGARDDGGRRSAIDLLRSL